MALPLLWILSLQVPKICEPRSNLSMYEGRFLFRSLSFSSYSCGGDVWKRSLRKTFNLGETKSFHNISVHHPRPGCILIVTDGQFVSVFNFEQTIITSGSYALIMKMFTVRNPQELIVASLLSILWEFKILHVSLPPNQASPILHLAPRSNMFVGSQMLFHE